MKTLDKKSVIGITALLVHAAKIDENYTESEKKLIVSFIKSYIKDDNLDKLLQEAENLEQNSNQLLNFTNIIKKENDEVKSDIIRHLWKIIISDKSVDQYESNLVRRICGLIYFSDKLSAEIKLQILNDE